MKGNRTRRIIQLLTVLQTRSQYTPDDLAVVLGTSKRTIFRDLKALQKAGVEYHFKSRYGRYETNSSFPLPSIGLTTEEAVALLLLSYKGRNHINFPMRMAALIAGFKIENNLHPRIRNYCSAVLKHITLQSYSKAAQSKLDVIFSQLQKAIMNKCSIEIRYYCLIEKKETDMKLDPYHLRYSLHDWYLFGKSCSNGQINALKLRNIKSVNILDSSFIEEPQFNIHDYLGRAWSMLPEGRLYNIKLRFIPEVADEVTTVQWHETQSHHYEQDGSAIVEFRVDGLNEIIWWILSYGDRVEVLTPRELRHRITEIAQRMINSSKTAPILR